MDPFRNRFWSQSQTPPPTPNDEVFSTPKGSIVETLDFDRSAVRREISSTSENTLYCTPVLQSQYSTCSNASEIFGTPESTLDADDVFTATHIVEVRKTHTNQIESRQTSMMTITEHKEHISQIVKSQTTEGLSLKNTDTNHHHLLTVPPPSEGVLRSKSDYEIPRKSNSQKPDGGIFQNIAQKSDSLFQNIGFLTPLSKRRTQSVTSSSGIATTKLEIGRQSTPIKTSPTTTNTAIFKLPASPILRKHSTSAQTNGQRAISLNSLKSSQPGVYEHAQQQSNNQQHPRFVENKKNKENKCPYELSERAADFK